MRDGSGTSFRRRRGGRALADYILRCEVITTQQTPSILRPPGRVPPDVPGAPGDARGVVDLLRMRGRCPSPPPGLTHGCPGRAGCHPCPARRPKCCGSFVVASDAVIAALGNDSTACVGVLTTAVARYGHVAASPRLAVPVPPPRLHQGGPPVGKTSVPGGSPRSMGIAPEGHDLIGYLLGVKWRTNEPRLAVPELSR